MMIDIWWDSELKRYFLRNRLTGNVLRKRNGKERLFRTKHGADRRRGKIVRELNRTLASLGKG